MSKDTASQELSTPMRHPVLRRLHIQRFRGLENYVWNPASGVNVLLGGGDVGKTTVLDAVALLLSPSNSAYVNEADFWRCETDRGFSIVGAFWFPDDSGALDGLRSTPWPWGWDGTQPTVPDLDAGEDDPGSGDSVLVFRVRASEDYEIFWEIVNPNETTDYLPVGVRRAIGLVWLEGDDRNDKDLRLVYGSALDRLLGDRALKSRLARDLSAQDVRSALSEDAESRLVELSSTFAKQALPASLSLGLAGGRGVSLNALIGLTAERDEQRLPLTSWGAGTRRLAGLQVAAANQSGSPITVVDEIERGLEPHRQRVLMQSLRQSGHQIFVTTHSPTVISCADEGSLWFLDGSQKIGAILGKAGTHARKDPEAFLSRLAIVAEGSTEVGFLEYLLDLALDGSRLECGVWVTDGGGNDSALELLESLGQAGVMMGGFVDYEGRNPERWKRVATRMGALFRQWEDGCLEENIVPLVPEEKLEAFIADPEDLLTGQRYRTLMDRLQTEDKSWPTLLAQANDIKKTIAEAAAGKVPDWVTETDRKTFKSHGRSWFKYAGGGTELARKCSEFGLWADLESDLLPFLNAIRQAVGLQPLPSMPE